MANDSAASNFPFQCILLIGATAGIGWHLADRLYQEGRKVIIVGRRKERLEEFIRQHDGSGDGNRKKPASYVFDVTQLEKLPEFIEKWVAFFFLLLSIFLLLLLFIVVL